jgi:outer membrane protein assembly factor BamB
MYSALNGALQATWKSLPAGSQVAVATTSFSAHVNYPTTTITKTAVSVLSGTVVLEQPHPDVIGQDIGGGAGGGALLVYIYGQNTGATTGWLACWNSTLAINSYINTPTAWNLAAGGAAMVVGNSVAGFPTIAQQQTTQPLDWNYGIMWNITIPNLTFMTTASNTTYATASGAGYTTVPATWNLAGADMNYVLLQSTLSDSVPTGTNVITLAVINVANQPMTTTYTQTIGGDTQVPTTGSFAWIENVTLPAYDQGSGTVFRAYLLDGGNIIIPEKTAGECIWDYSETTGTLLWTSTPFNNDFVLQSISAGIVANGIYYNPGYDGYMHAINTTTGAQIWDSISRTGGLEMPQPAYPMSGVTVAGGEVFTTTSKSYEVEPLYRGHCLYAYDATTGAQNWNISGQISVSAIVNGILVGTNSYDGRVYAFSRGQTATTVSAASWGGQNIVIQGTVTDQTPTSQAKGTPAISDAWMTPWMEYLYMDQPYPTNAVGVPVSIDAVDPNGNYIHIGNATSDISGTYSYQWTPPDIPGKYTIVASFSADNSYYGSSGETAAVVSAATTAVSPTPTPTSVADMYFVPAIAGLFVLIAIVAIVLALLMLRKRP